MRWWRTVLVSLYDNDVRQRSFAGARRSSNPDLVLSPSVESSEHVRPPGAGHAHWRDVPRGLISTAGLTVTVVVVVDGDVEESVADDEAVLTGGRRPRPGDQNTRGVDCSTMNLKRCRAGSWQWQPTDKKPLLVRWLCYVVVSCSGNGFGCINEVTRRRARLVLGRVTVFGRACNQPLRPTQPPTLSGTRNEYRPKCGDALRLEVKPRWMAHSIRG